MPDLWRRTGHTPDGDLYRKDLTKELRTTGRYALCSDAAGYPTPESRVRVIERRLEDEGSSVPNWEGGSPLGTSGVQGQLRNPPQFVVHRYNRTGLLPGSAAAELIHLPMTRTRHARRRP